MRTELSFAVVLAAAAIATPGAAVTRTDAAGDYLPTYAGPKNGDLDVLNFSAHVGGGNVVLASTQAAAVGTTAGGIYVWGVNRGAGTAGFGVSLGLTHVLFDAVVVLLPDGTGRVVAFTSGAPVITALGAGAVTISGSTIGATVPLALLPSTGFKVDQYGFNLWPRISGGTVANIADFAPNGATITGTVPEPASWALLVAGFGLVGALRRRTVAAA